VVTWRAAVAVPLALAAAHVVSVRSVSATAVAGQRVTLHVTTRPAQAALRVELARAGHRTALRGVRRHGARVTGRVPATTAPGRYRVLVCPAGGRCTAAPGRLTVLAAVTVPRHPLPTPPPGGSISPHPFPTPGPGS
jgi:hypothetical protein